MSARSLLIVEDHTMISEYIASVTAAAGFEPVQAFSLRQARNLLAMRAFDLWLCDLHLPDGDGSTLLSERIADPCHAATPAVALTAGLDDGVRTELIAAGFADALAKPCTPDRLLETLEKALGNASAPTSPARMQIPNAESAPVLDDESGLRVCGGDAQTLAAMRRLLASELPTVRARIEALNTSGDATGIDGELHKLSAAAAWCGATEAAEACAALKRSLHEQPGAVSARIGLDAALARLATALNHR